MRRLLSITAFALFLAVPLWAQRGVGHAGGFGGHAASGGGHASGFGGHVGGFSGRAFSGTRIRGSHFSGRTRSGFAQGPSRAFNRGYSRSRYLRDGFHNRDHFHHGRFRSNCYGYACRGGYGYPWWGAYYDPWFWDWSNDDARFDADYYNNIAQANEMNEQSLEQQRMLRQEEEDGDEDAYARPTAPRAATDPAPASRDQATSVVSPTVLVFRDQHQQEIQNYAIVGQTLWVFAAPHNQKVPLSELDLPATEKANDERGVPFQPPSLNEAQ